MPLTKVAPGARSLLIGYGNPGRGDDGLGPAFAEMISAAGLPLLSVEIDYQLTVDHAPLIAQQDRVIFADAAMGLSEPFRFEALEPSAPAALGSHSVTPAAVLTLARDLFGDAPAAFLLGISGSEFNEVKEGLSDTARMNLRLAADFFTGWYCAQQSPNDEGGGTTGR